MLLMQKAKVVPSRSESGQSMVEYALVIVLVAVVTIGVLWLLGAGVRDAFSRLFAPGAQAAETAPAPTLEATKAVKEEATQTPKEFFISLIDSFADKDGLDWVTGKGNWLVKNGQFESAGQGSLAYVSVPASNYTYSVDMVTQKAGKKSTGEVTQAVVRYQDENNYYVIIPNTNGTVELAKKQNGAWYSSLATANAGVDPTQSNNYSAKVNGSQIEVSVNGSLLIKYNDPKPITSGGAGAVNNGSSGAIDNVRIEPNP